MKKQIFYFLLLSVCSQGCDSCTKKKVTRTLNKSITLTYNLNNTGTTQSTSTYYASDIESLFQDYAGQDYTLERVDLKSFTLSGEIDKTLNTATTVQVTAVVLTDAGPTNATPLLSSTSMIKVGEVGLGVANSSGVPLNNALNSLNSAGLAVIKKVLYDRFSERKFPVSRSYPITIRLDCQIPNNQRLVGKIYLDMSAAVSYTNCEPLPTALIYNDEECK